MSSFKIKISCLLFLILFENCSKRKSTLIWEKNLPVIGSQSSLRATDLNNDGVLDLVIGAGKNEFEYSKEGVLAINGANGEILWTQDASDQVFGSATFCDITMDGIEDVIIGGRSPQLRALDGSNGKVVWSYEYKFDNHPILRYAKCNFYNSVLVPDIDGDSINDILIANGGNPTIEPFVETGRVPGVLMILSAKTGEILACDTMPDGKETYMSPIYFEDWSNNKQYLVFGSGGETISGNLYLGEMQDLISGNLENAKVIAQEKGHGYIAPPVLADITGDGKREIIALSHAGKATAIDGSNFEMIWENRINGTESSTSFAVGYFNDDNVPDVFTTVAKGQWPKNTVFYQVMLDGMTGKFDYIDSVGCLGFSSPVVYDLNDDGQDEIILSINDFDCSNGFANNPSREVRNDLMAIDIKNSRKKIIDKAQGFKNIFSTPWIGDLDNDKYLDIVYCQYFNYSPDMLSFLGMRVRCISTAVRVNKEVQWGAYMGSNGDGIFRP